MWERLAEIIVILSIPGLLYLAYEMHGAHADEWAVAAFISAIGLAYYRLKVGPEQKKEEYSRGREDGTAAGMDTQHWLDKKKKRDDTEEGWRR